MSSDPYDDQMKKLTEVTTSKPSPSDSEDKGLPITLMDDNYARARGVGGPSNTYYKSGIITNTNTNNCYNSTAGPGPGLNLLSNESYVNDHAYQCHPSTYSNLNSIQNQNQSHCQILNNYDMNLDQNLNGNLHGSPTPGACSFEPIPKNRPEPPSSSPPPMPMDHACFDSSNYYNSNVLTTPRHDNVVSESGYHSLYCTPGLTYSSDSKNKFNNSNIANSDYSTVTKYNYQHNGEFVLSPPPGLEKRISFEDSEVAIGNSSNKLDYMNNMNDANMHCHDASKFQLLYQDLDSNLNQTHPNYVDQTQYGPPGINFYASPNKKTFASGGDRVTSQNYYGGNRYNCIQNLNHNGPPSTVTNTIAKNLNSYDNEFQESYQNLNHNATLLKLTPQQHQKSNTTTNQFSKNIHCQNVNNNRSNFKYNNALYGRIFSFECAQAAAQLAAAESDWSPEKVLRLQRAPPVGAPLMMSLKNLVIKFFHHHDCISSTIDILARDSEIKACWKQIGRIPLWKLLKQFSDTMEQRQQSNGVWLISLTSGAMEAMDELIFEMEKLAAEAQAVSSLSNKESSSDINTNSNIEIVTELNNKINQSDTQSESESKSKTVNVLNSESEAESQTEFQVDSTEITIIGKKGGLIKKADFELDVVTDKSKGYNSNGYVSSLESSDSSDTSRHTMESEKTVTSESLCENSDKINFNDGSVSDSYSESLSTKSTDENHHQNDNLVSLREAQTGNESDSGDIVATVSTINRQMYRKFESVTSDSIIELDQDENQNRTNESEKTSDHVASVIETCA